jgi:hypothetical protein
MKKQQTLIQKEEEHVRKIRDTYAQKYPVFFALGTTFGFVATLYGFEKLIDRIDLFVDNPWILLLTGLVALTVTGTFFNKLR